MSGNGAEGVDGDGTAKARSSTITANGLDGIRGLRVIVKDTAATGNGTDASCGVTSECADVASAVAPRVTGTSTCGTSRNTEAGGSWGVCAND